MSTLTLGSFDVGRIKTAEDRKAYLRQYHKGGIEDLTEKMVFNDDDLKKNREFTELTGNEVTQLQEFLFHKGFMPRGVIDGVFDYVTQAAVRLFQEYVRSVEGLKIDVDGIVGSGTMKHMERWGADAEKVSDWKKWSSDNPTPEYTQWLALLNKAKSYYKVNSNPILDQVKQFGKDSAGGKETDTRKVDDWDFDPKQVHLIGIRRGQNLGSSARESDDLFVLLIKGMVFKFWGSTDPSQAMAYNAKNKKGRFDEAFLVEGQHKYKFGWHNSVYRALKPYGKGVLVFRDRNDDNALTEADLEVGLDPEPNHTINIHWSGIGKTNFSAGCQVIAGQSYINHKDEGVDCASFAAYGDGQLGNGKFTKAAYNVLADLIVSYSEPGIDCIYYTLGREKSLDIDANFGKKYITNAFLKFKPKLQ
ncbi:Putative peptidoglycan binding domain-containing protein [Pricia antarctica]|uniref:Putative peptidoglycan binding domain-containing protein n=1 Tax=Pricia antarctica TaxID=641691 RepID=A0A1G7E6V3_9FLAO|nr:peptidoglycan-binding domain-containing protein [Pricia antarctica]SDE59407.1 Putative peptidoglycan binding domain-containing protein [Pricia antarctica]